MKNKFRLIKFYISVILLVTKSTEFKRNLEIFYFLIYMHILKKFVINYIYQRY